MKDSLFWLFIIALLAAAFFCPMAYERLRPRHTVITHQTKLFDDVDPLAVRMEIYGQWEMRP